MTWSIDPPIRNNELKNTWARITDNKPGNPPPRVVAGQLRLDLNEGDILILASTVETRVDMSYATLSADFLRYTFNSQYVNPADPLDSEGIIARPMGENIWLSPHYRVGARHAHFQAPASGVYVFQHVVYGMSSAYKGDPAEGIGIVYIEQYATVMRQVTEAQE